MSVCCVRVRAGVDADEVARRRTTSLLAEDVLVELEAEREASEARHARRARSEPTGLAEVHPRRQNLSPCCQLLPTQT
jgi:hypothetical protein